MYIAAARKARSVSLYQSALVRSMKIGLSRCRALESATAAPFLHHRAAAAEPKPTDSPVHGRFMFSGWHGRCPDYLLNAEHGRPWGIPERMLSWQAQALRLPVPVSVVAAGP